MEKNRSGQLIYSDSFASHPNRYKMCLSIWPFGYNYLYFDLLLWSFDRDVEISSVNQITGCPHKKYRTKCAEYHNNSLVQKSENEKKLKLRMKYFIIRVVKFHV